MLGISTTRISTDKHYTKANATTPANATTTTTTTDAELVFLAKQSIDLLNARDFSNPFFHQHLASDIRVDLQGTVTYGFDAYLHNYIHDAKRSVNFVVDIDNVTATVDEKAGSGMVILSQYLRAFRSESRQMAGSISMHFDRVGGVWVCRNVIMMFGTPEVLL